MPIVIANQSDLAKLASSVIRNIALLDNPARCIIELDGPDEQRYILTLTPNQSVQLTPISVIVNSGIALNFASS